MIIVTAGPNLFNKGNVKTLIDHGLTSIRIPTSKQPTSVQLSYIEDEINNDTEVIIDLPGGKNRINNPINYSVKKDEILHINKSGDVYEFNGELCTYPEIDFIMSAGDIIIVGDGETAFSVIEDDGSRLIVKVLRDATLGPRRGITPNNKTLKKQLLTQNDYINMECLADTRVTGVMLSFVESSEDVKMVRNYIKDKYNRDVKIYSKVETSKGIHNADEIARESDYILLARGDLLITSGEKDFPILQKLFLDKCINFKDKTIIATELAHSICEGYLMSRAELTFLHSIASKGYTNLMLATETTILCNPIEAYDKVEELINYYSDHKIVNS